MCPFKVAIGVAILLKGIQEGIDDTRGGLDRQCLASDGDFMSPFISNREFLLGVLEELEAEDRKGEHS